MIQLNLQSHYGKTDASAEREQPTAARSAHSIAYCLYHKHVYPNLQAGQNNFMHTSIFCTVWKNILQMEKF